MREIFDAVSPMKEDQLLDMPDDLTTAFPREPLTWLRKYGIMDLELQRNNVQWSPSTKRLYFPIYDHESGAEMVACESRNFSGDGPKSIWKGQSKNDVIHVIGMELSGTIVVVEDIISAIKVGRHYPTLCLFGSSITDIALNRLRRLQGDDRGVQGITLWLDADKLSTALRIGQRASAMGITARVVYTDQDPKCYHNNYIIETVLDAVNNKQGEISGKQPDSDVH